MNLISWRGTPRGAEGAGRCKCEITLSYLQKALETGLGSWRMEERNHPSCLQEGQEGGSGEEQAGQAIILEDCPKIIKEKRLVESSHCQSMDLQKANDASRLPCRMRWLAWWEQGKQ